MSDSIDIFCLRFRPKIRDDRWTDSMADILIRYDVNMATSNVIVITHVKQG